MSCEAEQAEVNRLTGEAQALSGECDALAHGLGEDDPQVLSCRALQFSTEAQLAQARLALERCRAGQEAATRLLRIEGFLTFLRVNDLKTGFGGGQSNRIDAEVVFKLDTRPEKAFGFQLRDDKFRPAREGMLALLRDAFRHDFRVTADYIERVTPPNQNSLVIRVELAKPRSSGGPFGDVLAPT